MEAWSSNVALAGKEIVKELKAANKEVWPCVTEWGALLNFAGDTAIYMGTDPAGKDNKFGRDLACTALLEQLCAAPGAQFVSRKPFPFRCGKYATSSLKTYRMYQSAWMVADDVASFISGSNTAKLVAAYSRIAAVGAWPHDSNACPPQLTQKIKVAIMAALLFSEYQKGPAVGTTPTAEKNEKRIHALAFVMSVTPTNIQKMLQPIMAQEIVNHWCKFMADPRPNATPLQDLDKENQACAAIMAIGKHVPEASKLPHVERFTTIHLGSCDRPVLAKATAEFDANSPMYTPGSVDAAWAIAYIVQLHETIVASDPPPAARSGITLEATLFAPPEKA